MNKTEKKSPKISAHQKRVITIFLMCLIILIGIINFATGDHSKMVLKTAVISEETPVYMNPDLTEKYSVSFKKGDLVSVVYKHSGDVYYVLGAATEIPFLEGYLKDDSFTYKFDTANQGILNTDAVFSEKDEQKRAGYVVEKGRTPCIINSIDGDWASISLPGGIDGLFVKTADIIYDLNYDILYAEDFGHYRQVKDYMQEEYTSTYDKYYSNNYVRALSSYDEHIDTQTGEITCEFVLSGMSKNKYKDPDSVEYIKEAKEEAELSDPDRAYYETLYREYNMYRTGNFILKLTAITDGKNIDKSTIKLYSDMGVGASSDWKELENGLSDFIIE